MHVVVHAGTCVITTKCLMMVSLEHEAYLSYLSYLASATIASATVA